MQTHAPVGAAPMGSDLSPNAVIGMRVEGFAEDEFRGDDGTASMPRKFFHQTVYKKYIITVHLCPNVDADGMTA
jgi:hypothetical protein